MIKLQDLLFEQKDISTDIGYVRGIHMYAKALGFKLKQKLKFEKRIFNKEKRKVKSYTHGKASTTLNYIKPTGIDYPEILSAQAIADAYPGSTDWRTRPVNWKNLYQVISVVAEIQKNCGLRFELTGADDTYHRVLGYESDHTSGYALDFKVIGSNNDNRQNRVEKAIANYIINNDNVNITYINEFKKHTSAGSGGHYHLSIDPSSTDSCYFHFIKDVNGNSITGKALKAAEKIKLANRLFVDRTYQDLDPVVITRKKLTWRQKQKAKRTRKNKK